MLLTNCRLIDGRGSRPAAGSSIRIRDGLIVEISSGDPSPTAREDEQVVDLQNRTVLPGLINLHVHFHLNARGDTWRVAESTSIELLTLRATRAAKAMLRSGQTTAVDLGGKGVGVIALRDAINEGVIDGPRVLSAGRAICMTGGHFTAAGAREVDGVPGILQAAREEIKNGADFLKFMASAGMHAPPGFPVGAAELTEEEMAAGVRVAHAKGRKARAHAISNESVKNALRAGMDTIEHAPFIDDEVIELFLRRGATYVPTVAAYYQIMRNAGQGGLPSHAGHLAGQVHQAHFEALAKAFAAGVRIAVGTDGGSPFNPHDDIVTELEFFVQAGISTAHVLQMATRCGAEAMGIQNEVGTLEPGKAADIVVVDGDPLDDVSALRNVWYTIRQGSIVYQRDLTHA